LNAKNPVRQAILYTAVTIVALLMLLPFAWVLAGSFKTQAEFFSDPGAWLPRSLDPTNYIQLFASKGFGGYLVNSLIVSCATVVANLVLSSMAGYALAKLRFRGRRIAFAAVIAAMMVPYVALFVSSFVLIVQLGLANTLTAIILPMLVLPLSVFIMRQAAHDFPDDILEAARLDGASEAGLFARIVIPLFEPSLATVGVLSFLASWNSFLWPLIVAQSQDVYTLPVGLSVASQAANTLAFGLLLAGAVVVMVPVLLLFLFLQRYFIQGIATSGLK
jgi:multiple sugar transport system permease protein